MATRSSQPRTSPMRGHRSAAFHQLLLKLLHAFLWSLLPRSSAQPLSSVSPALLPLGRATALRIVSVAPPFEEGSYSVEVRQAGEAFSQEAQCTPAGDGSGDLLCEAVHCAAAGAIVGTFRRVDTQGEEWPFLLQGFLEPTVLAMTPRSLSLAGGKEMVVRFQDPLKAHNGTIVARMAWESNGLVVDTPLSVSRDSRSATGRARAVPDGVEAGSIARLYIAVNGQSFADTGLNVSFADEPVLKVGFIYEGEPSDFGWNFQHNKARLLMEDLFFGQVETIYQAEVGSGGPDACDFCSKYPTWNATRKAWVDEPEDFVSAHRGVVVMRQMIEEQGARMIFATSFDYHWDTFNMAQNYPDVFFSHVGGWLTAPNMAQVFPKIYQGRYLSGLVMASYIKERHLPKKVGYLSAFPFGETVRHINAFKLGLEKVDPEIELYVIWLESWEDIRKEKLAARQLIEFYGVEGIAQHVNDREPQLVAADYDKVGIGYNTDMLFTVGDSVLTSVVLVWGPDYANIVQQYLDGSPPGNLNAWNGLETGSWRLSDLSPRVSPEVRMLLQRETDAMRNGQDDIFCKPGLRDNKGRLRNGPANPTVNAPPWEAQHLRSPGSTCLSDPVVREVCQEYDGPNCVENWLLEGIYDSCVPTSDGGVYPPSTNGDCYLGFMTVPDQCPDGEYLNITGCVPAPRGSFAIEERLSKCGVGTAAPTEGLAQCRTCSRGSFSAIEGSTHCEPCAAGSHAEASGMSACVACEPGTFAPEEGMPECLVCAAGSFANATGQTECAPCQPGTATLAEGQRSCYPCPPGQYSGERGKTTCTPCGFGEYGASSGLQACTRCSTTDPFMTTFRRNSHEDAWMEVEGATSSASCGCEAGLYLDNTSGLCQPCGEGMTCEGMGEIRVVEGYYSPASEPHSVFKCVGAAERCPGGIAGTCKEGRATGVLTCAGCVSDPPHYSLDDGTCKPCDSDALLPFIGLALVVLVVLTLLYLAIDSGSRAKMTNSKLLLIVASGQLITVGQQLFVLSQLTLDWPHPFRSFLRFYEEFNFQMVLFRLNCFIFLDPLGVFASKMLIVVSFLVAMVLIHLVVVAVRHGCRFRARNSTLVGAAGSLCMAFFIALICNVLDPLDCISNPNGRYTIRNFQAVLCWDPNDDMHERMITVGVVSMIIPVVFITGVIYAVRALPMRMSNGDTDFLHAYNFLFFRFRPETHWFVLPTLLRNVLVGIAPILPEAMSEILLLHVVLLLYLSIALFVFPFRSTPTNMLEVISSIGVILLLLVAAFVLEAQNQETLSTLCFIFIAVILSAIFVAIGAWIRMRFCCVRKTFQYFICHHKAGAGSFARLLKMKLMQSSKVKRGVFLDSDNLQHLGTLFDMVGTDTECIVALCTRDLLARPWCVGELTTARLQHVGVVLVLRPDFSWPSDAQIDSYSDYVPDIFKLTEYGMGELMVRDTLRWLSGLSQIVVRGPPSGALLSSLTSSIVSGGSWYHQPGRPAQHVVIDGDLMSGSGSESRVGETRSLSEHTCVVLLVDHSNPEALAAACILELLLIPLLVHHDRKWVPRIVDASGTLPERARQVVLVCTNGCFVNQLVARELVKAHELSVAVLPVVTEETFQFPSDATYEAMLDNEVGGVNMVKAVKAVFEEIAVVVTPGDSEQILQTRARSIADRVVLHLKSESPGRLMSPRSNTSRGHSGFGMTQSQGSLRSRLMRTMSSLQSSKRGNSCSSLPPVETRAERTPNSWESTTAGSTMAAPALEATPLEATPLEATPPYQVTSTPTMGEKEVSATSGNDAAEDDPPIEAIHARRLSKPFAPRKMLL